MKKIRFLVLIFFSTYALGCSIPRSAKCDKLYGFTRTEKNIKGFLGSKIKDISVKDFRGSERYDEDMLELQEEVDKYILAHPQLSESARNNLKELKVAEGSTTEETGLLLGKPDRMMKVNDKIYGADQVWIYRIKKIQAFIVLLFPVFLSHEGYYLYFKDNLLKAIERHYLEQVVQLQDPGMGSIKKFGTATEENKEETIKEKKEREEKEGGLLGL